LESVVGDYHVAAWKKRQVAVEDLPLVQFYLNYWGLGMEEEVTEWQKSQAEDMDVDNNKVGGDEDEGKGKGKEVEVEEEEEEEEEEDKDEDEEDEDEEEGKVDDYIEGCYVLDINIKGIESSIWVRAEYIRIFNDIAELHGDLTSSKRIDESSYCVIITGQPGIGEFNLT
jgi:hypothetical protein